MKGFAVALNMLLYGLVCTGDIESYSFFELPVHYKSIKLKRGFRLFPPLYVVCGAALQGASAGPPIAVVPRHFEVLGRL